MVMISHQFHLDYSESQFNPRQACLAHDFGLYCYGQKMWTVTQLKARFLALVDGAESDEELQDDDPEVEEEPGDGQATRTPYDDQDPVGLPNCAQRYNHLKHGRKAQADDDDHDVDQPRQHEPSVGRRCRAII